MGYALGACNYLTKPNQFGQAGGGLRRATHTDGALVLVIDDNPAARQMMRGMLTKDGWSVSEAENGRVGLDRLRGRRPWLWCGPDNEEVDGSDLIEILRKTQAWQPFHWWWMATAKDVLRGGEPAAERLGEQSARSSCAM